MANVIDLGRGGPIKTRLYFEDNKMYSADEMSGRAVQMVLDQNARDRAEGHNPHAIGRHAARVPLTLLESWRQDWKRNHKDKWEWSTFLAMKLNSADYKHLRTGVSKL